MLIPVGVGCSWLGQRSFSFAVGISRSWDVSLVKVLGVRPSAPTMSSPQAPPSRLRDGKDRKREGEPWDAIFWAPRARPVHELTATMAACTRPVKDQTSLSPGVDGVGGLQAPPFAEELFLLIAAENHSEDVVTCWSPMLHWMPPPPPLPPTPP